LELELRAARDHNQSLVEQAKVKDARFHDEFERLLLQVVKTETADPAVDRAQTPQLESELAAMHRTMKSLSDNLTLQVEESGRLHAQVVSQKREFRRVLESHAKECSEASALLMSLQSLLHCSDAPQVVQEVQRLFANDEDARRSIAERTDFERRLSDEVVRNRALAQRLSQTEPEDSDRITAERDGLRKESRIEELTRGLADHFERDFDAGNNLAHHLSALFRRIASAAEVDEIVPEIDALVTNGTDLLTQAFIATSDRLTRYHEVMETVQQRVEQLSMRVDGARKLKAKGSRIPTIGKVKAPGLGAKNPAAREALRPRQFPVSVSEPKERRFV
jgi:hypothetical protein